MRIVKFLLFSTLTFTVWTSFANCTTPDFSPYLGKHITKRFTPPARPYHGKKISQYSAVMLPGSLKYNVVQIANQYGWNNVIWQMPDDYTWVGRTRINASSLSSLFNKILSNYPLQAQFYQGNHVLVIAPRNLP